jgi:hypothetical protein
MSIGTTISKNEKERTWSIDLHVHPNAPHASIKALVRKTVIVSREFVFDMRSGVQGGTFLLDEKLVTESRRSSSLQQLVLFKHLLDEMNIVFWLSGSSAELIKYECDDQTFETTFSTSIEIGVHKFDWSSAVISHLGHMSFKEINKRSPSLSPSSHHMQRPFYCSSEKTSEKDWRTANELQECGSSVRLKNAMGVELVVRLFDEDDSGRLSSESDYFVPPTSEGKNAGLRSTVKQRTTYTGRMKLLWLDWMGRRWRVPNEAPLYV